MTDAELVPSDGSLPALPAGLGPAAERFARNTLRKSKQTQRTYLSVYGRFTAHLSALTGVADPPPSALTADAVAGYLDALEGLGRSPATVRKERAALNRLTRYLQLVGAIDHTTALEILELLARLGLRDSDDGSALVMLRQNRGQLVVRHQDHSVEVVARGRGDWLGWVELKTQAVDEVSTKNTARVITELDADILAVVEAETRHSLRDFSRVMLRKVGGEPYEHTMLIEGNDDRGINVGLNTKDGFEIDEIRTHIFDLVKPNEAVFSRDCPEYLVRTPGASEILVLVNHFKSKRGGGDARRLLQAKRVREIVLERLPEHPNLVVVGDFNDTPDSANLAPLLTDTPLKDISTHAAFDDGGFAGTFGTQGAANRIDYILLSPDLLGRVTAGGILRNGVFSASNRWPMLPTVTKKIEQASDHAAIWAELDLP